MSPGALEAPSLPELVTPLEDRVSFAATFTPRAATFEALVELHMTERAPFGCPDLPPLVTRLDLRGHADPAGPCE